MSKGSAFSDVSVYDGSALKTSWWWEKKMHLLNKHDTDIRTFQTLFLEKAHIFTNSYLILSVQIYEVYRFMSSST